MVEILSHPAFRGKQEVETSTQTVRRVPEAQRLNLITRRKRLVLCSSRKDSDPEMMPSPEKWSPNQPRNDPRVPCYRPRNYPRGSLNDDNNNVD